MKPLRLSQSGQQPEGTGPAKSDEPDWLSQLRADRPGSLASEETEGKHEEPHAEDADAPDWLSRIRDRARTETGDLEKEPDWMQDSPSEPPANQGVEDWLSRLPGGQAPGPAEQKPPAQPQPSTSSEPSGQEESADDLMSKLSAWQAGLSEQEGGPPPAETPTVNAQDDFDWLNEQAEPPSGHLERSFFSGTGVTDFLHSLDQLPPMPGAQTPGAEAPEEGAPQVGGPQSSGPQSGGGEWLSSEVEKPADQGSSGYGLTGFLASLKKPGVPQEQPGEMNENAFPGLEQPAGAPSPEEMPDWFSSEQSGQEAERSPFSLEAGEGAPAPGEENGDLAGWLKSLGNETPEQPPAGESAPSEAETGIPDWLKGAAESSPFAQGEPGPFENGTEGLPEWLGSVEKKEEQPSSPEPVSPFTQLPEEPEAEKSDLPAWMSGAETTQSAAPQFEETQENEPAAGLPAWLSGDFASAGEPAALEQAGPPLMDEGNLPDWFASFEQTDVEKTQPSRTGQLRPREEAPAEPAAPVEPAEGSETFAGVPDWLQQFQRQQHESDEVIPPLVGEEQEQASPLAGFAGSGLFANAPSDQAAENGDQPFTVDLPDWLGEDTAARPVEATEQPSEGMAGDEQLARAELPEWVKDMRPLESILPGEGGQAEVDQRVEKSGPLAGMRGVLPADEAATRYRKPPIYSVRLRVTEKQRTQQILLESILSQESQPLLIPPERSRATGVVGRVLLAVFLLIALAFPVVYDIKALAMPSPAMFPAENQMYQIIDKNLQANAPVLVAVEYDPALSGEMRLAAGPVIDQLIAKNARIVLVSTTPAGPALGQQLLEEASASYPNYSLAEQTVNLGYLPGGTISLVDFAQQPDRAASSTVDARQAWRDTFLKGVSGLSGFSQIIVLTDRDEVGRAWVEQVQPQLGKVPLLMVTSAQAAPLLQPYYESGQIAGLTSGMLGGVIYAQLAGLSNSNSRTMAYFSAYQIGVILAFGVVLVGGFISAGVSLFKRKAREEE